MRGIFPFISMLVWEYCITIMMMIYYSLPGNTAHGISINIAVNMQAYWKEHSSTLETLLNGKWT